MEAVSTIPESVEEKCESILSESVSLGRCGASLMAACFVLPWLQLTAVHSIVGVVEFLHPPFAGLS